MPIKYKRIVIKISGEGLKASSQELFNEATIQHVIKQIKYLYKLNIQIAIVVGAGNIFRGNQASKFAIEQTNAHYIGMIATNINAIALKDYFIHAKLKVSIYSALPIANVVKAFNHEQAIADLEDNKIVIFAGGTGNPYATTDSAAALRAAEIKAKLLIKATQVNGVYDKDPKEHTDAIKFKTLKFNEAINKQLNVMDVYAFDLCRTQQIDIAVCNLEGNDSIIKAALGETDGTLIT